jgi:putative transposase
MKKTKHSEEKITGAVKQLEAGCPVKELARELGVTDQTLYNWKSKYGGLEVSDAKRLRALEEENRRLKEMVADLSLDKEALKTVFRKNVWSADGLQVRIVIRASLRKCIRPLCGSADPGHDEVRARLVS